MRTTINLSAKLVEEARALAGTKTKTETIELALRELIRRHRIKHLISRFGKLDLDIDIPKSRRRP